RDSHTTVDPPELVRFIRENYHEVSISYPELTMWQLIVKKRIPPTRQARFCCDVLKEQGGTGRVVVTGVRWAESNKRKNNRAAFEIMTKSGSNKKLMNDNDEARKMFETCMKPEKNKRIVNPIIDWEDQDVWGYIKSRGIKYCSLYDEGFERLGCIGCPLATQKSRENEFKRWPTYKRAYIRSFQKMVNEREALGLNSCSKHWTSAQRIFDWWMEYTPPPPEIMDGQIEMDDVS
ncbi:MAG: phosphoadenosine phosphosulfate reductase family protein, partial [Deltaproteobacteria bacterium]|nr:phosphoadenosine phosphosulfate reductase family protein [Deltaproteobacteria bacterium]